MSSNFYNKKEWQANLGKALRALGWTLLGWKEDRSDSMTDYFDPESWDGVGTKGEFVACVDIGPYHVESRSGKATYTYATTIAGPCDRCGGTGREPDGWTLEQARANPAIWKRLRLDREHGPGHNVVSLTNAISPLHFGDGGFENCVRCHGTGNLVGKSQQVVEQTFPVFQANPKGCTWHVERNGQVVGKGVGLSKCATVAGLGSMAARIDKLVPAPAPAPAPPADEARGVCKRKDRVVPVLGSVYCDCPECDPPDDDEEPPFGAPPEPGPLTKIVATPMPTLKSARRRR